MSLFDCALVFSFVSCVVCFVYIILRQNGIPDRLINRFRILMLLQIYRFCCWGCLRALSGLLDCGFIASLFDRLLGLLCWCVGLVVGLLYGVGHGLLGGIPQYYVITVGYTVRGRTDNVCDQAPTE